MIPGWYINNNHPFYEFFISEYGQYITYTNLSGVYVDKYSNMDNFKKVESEKTISILNKDLIKHLLEHGWQKSGQDEDVEFLK